MSTKHQIHIIGTHGVPARYGGFETLADLLCQNLGNQFDITVYCNSGKYPKKPKKYFIWGFEEPENSYEYKNAKLLAERFVKTFSRNSCRSIKIPDT